MKEIIVFFLAFCLSARAAVSDTASGESESVFLTSLPPEAPVLVYPENQETEIQDTVSAVWRSQVHTSTFTVHLSESSDFASFTADETIADTCFTLSGLSGSAVYHWRVYASNAAGDGDFSETRTFTTLEGTSVKQETEMLPLKTNLLPVYPNPFNPSTTIVFELSSPENIHLAIYNNLGQQIRRLALGMYQAGRHILEWDGCDHRGVPVTSGLYFCRLEAGGRAFTQKMLLMR